MLAIGVDDLSNATGIVQELNIPFPVLYDPSGGVPQSYRVYELIEPGLATSSTFVVDRDGVIRWKYVAGSIGDRLEAATVIKQLSALEG